MNWGLRIIIALGLFMLFIAGSVVYMLSKSNDDLQESDYYEKSIHYDETMDMKQNVFSEQLEPRIEVVKGEVSIIFADDVEEGTVFFRRPSDKSLDREWSLSKVNEVSIPSGDLTKGLWNCILKWKSADKEYLYETNIHL